jgi:hypothetical protein
MTPKRRRSSSVNSSGFSPAFQSLGGCGNTEWDRSWHMRHVFSGNPDKWIEVQNFSGNTAGQLFGGKAGNWPNAAFPLQEGLKKFLFADTVGTQTA